MPCSITGETFEPWQLVADYQAQHTELSGQIGATAVFVGTMRDFNEGDTVTGMQLEHYPGMTDKYLDKIISNAKQQWNILDVLIVHRVGEIKPNDPIVLVAVWASHRAHAYEANRYLMEELKSKAPFWKKEQLENDQTRWVEKNTSGVVE